MRKALITTAALLVVLATGVAASPAVACSSGTAAIPTSYLSLYKSWGSVAGVPWSLLAAVGSVESNHGTNPKMLVPHDRGVLGPMQFQAGSNKLARKQNSDGDQGFGGTWAEWRTASGHPPYRMDDPDDEIAAAAAKLKYDAGPTLNWTRALYRYNALGAYVNLVLKRAKAYRLGTCVPDASSSIEPSDTTSAPTEPVDATVSEILDSTSIELSAAAAGDLQAGIVDSRLISLLGWIAERHSIEISEFRTGHSKYVAGTRKVSNNWYGRAATIVAVDGMDVSPGSAAARTLWNQLRTAPLAIRPIEIGAPWADASNGRFYSGSDAMNLIHVGFDGPTQH